MNIKKKNEKEKQATKVLYVTVAAMLVVMAVIVMLSSMLSRANRPSGTDSQSGTTAHTGAPDTQRVTDAPDSGRPLDSLPVIADTDRDTDASKPVTPPSATVPTLSVPTLGILSKEHSDSVLVYSSTMEDYRTHMGIDINAALGDKVYATATGTVADVWYDPMMGRCVRVEHNGGLETIYKNMAEELCEGIGIGSSLLAGDVIGYVGESAMIEIAQEPHLHFEAKIDGKYVDPMQYMSAEARATLLEDTGFEG